MSKIRLNQCGDMPRKQTGVALAITLVMLVFLSIIGISAMRTSSLEERMAGGIEQLSTAFHGAETGISVALTAMTADKDLVTPSQTEDSPLDFDYKIVNGTVCDTSEPACDSLTGKPANTTKVDMKAWYTGESETPPAGFSLDNDSQMTAHNFRVLSTGVFGTSKSDHYQGTYKLGPKGS